MGVGMAKDVKARYAIVMVDKVLNCPIYVGITGFCKVNDGGCDNCKMKTEKGNYGDTKEQMILKVAQVLIKDEMKYCKWETKVQKEVCWQNNMELAKEIVEFLGVEDGRKNI